jgi:hypothetical protein
MEKNFHHLAMYADWWLLSTMLTPTSGDLPAAGIPSTRPAEIRRRVGVLPERAVYLVVLPTAPRRPGPDRRELTGADRSGPPVAPVACSIGHVSLPLRPWLRRGAGVAAVAG